jgi:hypothetical protein
MRAEMAYPMGACSEYSTPHRCYDYQSVVSIPTLYLRPAYRKVSRVFVPLITQ